MALPKQPTGAALVFQVFAGLVLILVIDTAFLFLLVGVLLLAFGLLGFHISITGPNGG